MYAPRGSDRSRERARYFEHTGVQLWSARVEAANVAIQIDHRYRWAGVDRVRRCAPARGGSRPRLRRSLAWPDRMPPDLAELLSGYVVTATEHDQHSTGERWEADVVDAPLDLFDAYFAAQRARPCPWAGSDTVAGTVQEGASIHTVLLDREPREGARHLTVMRSGG